MPKTHRAASRGHQAAAPFFKSRSQWPSDKTCFYPNHELRLLIWELARQRARAGSDGNGLFKPAAQAKQTARAVAKAASSLTAQLRRQINAELRGESVYCRTLLWEGHGLAISSRFNILSGLLDVEAGLASVGVCDIIEPRFPKKPRHRRGKHGKMPF